MEVRKIDLVKRYSFIKVLPIYTFINKSNNEFLNYLKSFLIPFKLKYLKDVDNQTTPANGS